MAMFKSKGKHSQGAHARPEGVPQEAAENKESQQAADVASAGDSATAPVASSGAPSGNQADATVAIGTAETLAAATAAPASPIDLPSINIEDYVGEAASPSAGPAFVAASDGVMLSDGVVLQKKRRVGKVIGITFGVIIGVLLLAYIAGAIVFMNWFFPRTSIVGHDISMMSNGDVVSYLNNSADNYVIDVTGDGLSYRATSKDIGMSVDAEGIVSAMHADLNAWAWPMLLFQDAHDESAFMNVKYNKQSYESQIKSEVEKHNSTATAPVDATIAYDDKTKKFVVVPEQAGTMYDADAILASMDEAISTLEPSLKLTSEHLVQPKVLSTDERLVNSAELATGLVSAHVTLTMAGQKVADISGDNLSQFIRLDDAMGVTLDEAALDQWVTNLSNGFDTVGTERTYTRPDGKVITVDGGAYGWLTDAPALKDQIVAAIKSGTDTTVDIPCEQEAAVYNGLGQPDWGPRYIDVDLSEQYVRFYDGDAVIWESACVSGSPDGQHNTWPGVWYITNKESPSKLIGYLPSGEKEYESTVSYWMAFEGNGIGLHDATWQPAFGGDMYASGYGSHGCVNLPYDAAAELYEIANWGEVVIAHF